MQELRASKLLGAPVRGVEGSALGEISDLIVDTGTGRVHYAVLTVGGFFVARMTWRGVVAAWDRAMMAARERGFHA